MTASVVSTAMHKHVVLVSSTRFSNVEYRHASFGCYEAHKFEDFKSINYLT